MRFFKKRNQMKQLIPREMNLGCIASRRITADGMKVGYMYRAIEDTNFPDSGWRFFSGDEDDAYTLNPDNFQIFALNTICNYDQSVIPYLNAPYGSAFIKENGAFVADFIDEKD